MPDNSPRQARRVQAEPTLSLTPQPKLGSANQTGAVVAEARQAQLELTPGDGQLPVVEVVDTPVERPAVKVEEPVEEQQVSAEQLAPLQRQVEDAQRQSQEQYRARAEADRQTQAARIQAADANRLAVENGLTAAKAKADAAEVALTDAHARADAAAIAKATRAMTAADREIGVFEGQKTAWEQYAAQVKAAPPVQQVVTPVATETMDVGGRSVDLTNYTPAERKWIKANPQFMTDVSFNQTASTAAQMALNMGYSRDSQEYIDYIASQTASRPSQQETIKVEQPKKPTVTAAAPVSRSAIPLTNGGAQKLTLSRTPMEDTNGLSEVEAAELSYPDKPKHEAYALYAKDREALIEAGHPGMAAVIQRRA